MVTVVTKKRLTVTEPDRLVRCHNKATGEMLVGPWLACLNSALPMARQGETLVIEVIGL